MIRMVDLVARHSEVAEAVEAGVLDVLRSGRWVGGPVVAEAEALAAAWLGRREAVGVNSGTDALVLALQAVGVRPGHEVVVPALTFFATAGAVCAVGAVPVIVDVREDGCMDPDAARAACTSRTAAILPVHLYGTRATAPDLGVPVVDDAAQAIGASPPASIGALTAVSTYPTKTWGAAGDGGFVVGDDVEAVRRLANHGIIGPSHHAMVNGVVGRNSRLDAVQAAVLLGHAPSLPARIARRRRLAARYDAQLPSTVRPLPRDEGSPVHQYVVRVADRARVQAALAERGIQTAVYYPRTLCDQPALAHAVRHATPVATALAREVLALPVHAGLEAEQVDRVCAALTEMAR
ncbi:MAG: dTDP-4-amino-4,6-dideoxygalactose transaminase [Myxococcota bacterium]|jgi:dTDP-4-amino-4,6-dideoxygalactose transaminase